MSQAKINVFRVKTPDGFKEFVSLLPGEEVFAHGIAPEAIVGEFTQLLPENAPIPTNAFIRNSLFVELMHNVIAREAPKLKSFQSEAKKQNNGWVYVIDRRTQDPKGEVPKEDVVGAFEAKNGKMVEGSYAPNRNHRIYSARGFFDLGAELYELLLAELRLRNGKK